jgi:hypothetical protein
MHTELYSLLPSVVLNNFFFSEQQDRHYEAVVTSQFALVLVAGTRGI